MPDEIERWSAFTDKELRTIQSCIYMSKYGGTIRTATMSAEIDLELDRRWRADKADQPRATFERKPEIDKLAIRKVADELWDLGDKDRASRIHDAFGGTPPRGEITNWKG